MKALGILTVCALLALPLGAGVRGVAAEDAPATQPASGTPTITPEEAGKHMGKEVIVEGTVTTTKRSQKYCFLNFGSDKKSFYVVIFEPALSSAKEAPELAYKGKKIQVKGTVESHRERPQIVVKDLGQITVVADK